jgi:hypothetical protein
MCARAAPATGSTEVGWGADLWALPYTVITAHLPDVEEHVVARDARKAVFERDEPLKFWTFLHEAVLHRAIGGDRVMAAQLDYLIDVADSPHVTLQVIPNAYGAHAGMITSFQLLRFSVAPQFGLVYLKQLGGAFYYDSPADVELYDSTVRHIIKATLPEEQSVQLIKKIKKEHYT